MIKTLNLPNFKAFKDMGSIDIRNLTIIVGKNSCGKSSILQSLLLLKQTLDSESKQPLCLDGKYLKYSNLKELSFGLPAVNSAKISYDISVGSDDGKLSGSVKFGFKNKKECDGYTPTVSDYLVTVDENEDANVKSSKLSFSSLSVSKTKKVFKKFLNRFDDEGKLVDVKILSYNFLPQDIQLTYEKEVDGSCEQKTIKFPLFFVLDEEMQINSLLNDSIKNLRYLSPIRATPERAYVHYSQDVSKLNEDGSNSAHILWTKRDQKVRWRNEELVLSEALNKCIDTVGLSQSITPDKVGDIIYKVGIRENNSGANVSLADVGFGYSQIIPIILMGLLNSKDNLLLIEQPEIHLHPSSAGNLADLFLGFVDDGKRFIIETHSQEFINKLRLRVIQNPELKKKINIVFVEQQEDSLSHIKQFEIDENGMFPEWPEGFVDETENIARQILQARLGIE